MKYPYTHRGLLRLGIILLWAIAFPPRATTQTGSDFHSTSIGISAGMGVNYHTALDIVNRVNGSGITSRRVDEFTSAVEFFGAVSVPLSTDWVIKGEYVYMLASHSLPSPVIAGTVEFTYVLHMPTIVGQYILFEAPSYNLKAGAGLGFHFGSYDEKFFRTSYNASGLGSLLELEGNTALGEKLFAHLGTQFRWEFVGELRNNAGQTPLNAVSTTLHFFSIGARLGITYYL
jgi:hypothetical protein